MTAREHRSELASEERTERGIRPDNSLRLTARGWPVTLLGVTTLALGSWWRYPGLAAIGAALAVLVLVDLALVGAAGPIRIRRVVEPLQVPRHGHCRGTLTIGHSGRLPVVVDGLEPVGTEHVQIAATWLGREPVDVTYDVPTRVRGVRTIGPARLRRLGPSGLAAREETAGGDLTVRVLPRVLPVRAVPPGARRGQVRGDERVARGGTDLVALREYVPGDDLRRVHWATSARTGTVMVRDDADPSQAELTILLDDNPAHYSSNVEHDFEEAVDVAAALTVAASAAGHPVRLRTTSGRVDVTHTGASAGTGRAAPELLAALADVALANADASAPAVSGPGDLDVLAVISGAEADERRLALTAATAAVGVVLAVGAEPVARAVGSVIILRGRRAEDLLSTWDSLVVGGAP